MNLVLQKLKSVFLKIKTKSGGYLLKLFFLIVILTISTFLINLFSYFDPFSFCYIGIDNDIVKGNQSSIKKAIILIKKNDPEDYDVLCKYVDTVAENNCPGLAPGCYIKGSKIVLLSPTQDESALAVVTRVQTIKKYAYFSKNFWDSW